MRRGSAGTPWEGGRRRVVHFTLGSRDRHFKYLSNQVRGALERILRVLRIAQAMALAGVDHDCSRHTLGLSLTNCPLPYRWP
jgi:hypothetical protein